MHLRGTRRSARLAPLAAGVAGHGAHRGHAALPPGAVVDLPLEAAAAATRPAVTGKRPRPRNLKRPLATNAVSCATGPGTARAPPKAAKNANRTPAARQGGASVARAGGAMFDHELARPVNDRHDLKQNIGINRI